MKRSGAMIAWDFFHKGKEVPNLIQYIQDRDLWKWEFRNSKEVSAGLQLLPMDFDSWKPYLDNKRILDLIATGKVILSYQEQQIKSAISREIRMVRIGEHLVPILNTTTLVSEVCGTLAEDHTFAITYFDTATDRVYSLRSRRDGVDVSEVAKEFNGGGHISSAGFSIPLSKSQL